MSAVPHHSPDRPNSGSSFVLPPLPPPSPLFERINRAFETKGAAIPPLLEAIYRGPDRKVFQDSGEALGYFTDRYLGSLVAENISRGLFKKDLGSPFLDELLRTFGLKLDKIPSLYKFDILKYSVKLGFHQREHVEVILSTLSHEEIGSLTFRQISSLAWTMGMSQHRPQGIISSLENRLKAIILEREPIYFHGKTDYISRLWYGLSECQIVIPEVNQYFDEVLRHRLVNLPKLDVVHRLAFALAYMGYPDRYMQLCAIVEQSDSTSIPKNIILDLYRGACALGIERYLSSTLKSNIASTLTSLKSRRFEVPNFLETSVVRAIVRNESEDFRGLRREVPLCGYRYDFLVLVRGRPLFIEVDGIPFHFLKPYQEGIRIGKDIIKKRAAENFGIPVLSFKSKEVFDGVKDRSFDKVLIDQSLRTIAEWNAYSGRPPLKTNLSEVGGYPILARRALL